MSKNRVVYVLIVAALLSAIAISLRQVMITRAAAPAQADRSYDAIENLRSFGRSMPGFAASKQADRSYDGIEGMRGSRSASTASNQADRSYDVVESIRQNRNLLVDALQADHSYDAVENVRLNRN